MSLLNHDALRNECICACRISAPSRYSSSSSSRHRQAKRQCPDMQTQPVWSLHCRHRNHSSSCRRRKSGRPATGSWRLLWRRTRGRRQRCWRALRRGQPVLRSGSAARTAWWLSLRTRQTTSPHRRPKCRRGKAHLLYKEHYRANLQETLIELFISHPTDADATILIAVPSSANTCKTKRSRRS